MHRIVNDAALDALFRSARSHYAWLARPVSDTLLRALGELVKRGPTSGIADPGRLLFVRSEPAKSRLGSAVPARARGGLTTAPVAAIIGSVIDRDQPSIAVREGGLQAACLILATRALGLDCGPIWEFDSRAVEDLFFPEGNIAATFLCAIGYGDDTQPASDQMPPGIDETCGIL